jgi:hypothetical protein
MGAMERMQEVRDRIGPALEAQGFRSRPDQPLQGRIVAGWERTSAWRRDRVEVGYAKRDPRGFTVTLIVEVGPVGPDRFVVIDETTPSAVTRQGDERYVLPGGILPFGFGRFLARVEADVAALLPWIEEMYGTQEVTVARLAASQRRFPEPGSRDHREALAFLDRRPGITPG